jgi:hypothetical protein
LIFVAEARSLLAWGTSSDDDPLRLNVLALAETTYLFADLVHRLNTHLRPPPETWQYVIGLQRMELNGKRPSLAPGARRSTDQLFASRRRVLPTPDFEYRSPRIPIGVDPRVVAFRLRQELYVAFGFDREAIPYVIDVGGEPGTDPEKIKVDGQRP